MTLARRLIGAVCLLAAAVLLGAETEANKPPDLATLRKEQQELAVSMHRKRVELLEKDASLKELHRKIMELHRELALRLDNHRELRELAKRMRDLEFEIRRREEALGIRKKPDKDALPNVIEIKDGD